MNIFTKQFQTYDTKSISNGNKPIKNKYKVWINWKKRETQFEHKTLNISEVHPWYQYHKVEKLRNGFRNIIYIEDTKKPLGHCIHLNLFEQTIEFLKDKKITPIFAWMGGLKALFDLLKSI